MIINQNYIQTMLSVPSSPASAAASHRRRCITQHCCCCLHHLAWKTWLGMFRDVLVTHLPLLLGYRPTQPLLHQHFIHCNAAAAREVLPQLHSHRPLVWQPAVAPCCIHNHVGGPGPREGVRTAAGAAAGLCRVYCCCSNILVQSSGGQSERTTGCSCLSSRQQQPWVGRLCSAGDPTLVHDN